MEGTCYLALTPPQATSLSSAPPREIPLLLPPEALLPSGFPFYLCPLLSPEMPGFTHKLSAALLPSVLRASPSNQHPRTELCWG